MCVWKNPPPPHYYIMPSCWVFEHNTSVIAGLQKAGQWEILRTFYLCTTQMRRNWWRTELQLISGWIWGQRLEFKSTTQVFMSHSVAVSLLYCFIPHKPAGVNATQSTVGRWGYALSMSIDPHKPISPCGLTVASTPCLRNADKHKCTQKVERVNKAKMGVCQSLQRATTDLHVMPHNWIGHRINCIHGQ